MSSTTKTVRRLIGCVALGVGLAALPVLAMGETLRFESGVRRITVVELFTSEGCSSCPPAEAHLNAYVDQPGLWDAVIPLAFHVDYWDDLGWEDPFGDTGYSQRQRRYARLGRVEGVYTPAFVVNGRGTTPGTVPAPAAADAPPVGNLVLALSARRLRARFYPAGRRRAGLALNVAVVGMGHESRITAGENAGRHARHEFVVLAHAQARSGETAWQTMLPPIPTPHLRDATRMAVVGWISRPPDPTPLQAAGGYLPADWSP